MDISKISNYVSTIHIPKINRANSQQILNNVSKIALPAIALIGASYLPGTDAGLFSGLAVGVACFGAGAAFPGNLFWAAAPCYEAAMIATANPLLP